MSAKPSQRQSRPKPRRSRSYRFGEDTVKQLKKLSVAMNASQTWVLEEALRRMAKKEGI